MKAYTNCTIYTGSEILKNHSILIRNNRISEIVTNNNIPDNCELTDLNNLNIAPGFIDLHINGCGGKLFNNDISHETLKTMHKTNLKSGTTSFLPTIISSSDEKMHQAIDIIENHLREDQNTVLGLHFEGPYINLNKKGVQDHKYIRKMDKNMLKTICGHGGNTIKMITLSPETIDHSYITALQESKIAVSIGHSEADYETACKAFKAGVTMCTHLFNAMPPINSRNPHLTTAILDNENIYAMIIADGFHVSYPSIRIAKKLKKEKLILVTDAMPPAGTNINTFELSNETIYCREGKCTTKDGTIAGSALTLSSAVKNCVQNIGIDLDEALRMASTYPAKAINVHKFLGKIKKDYIANLVVFDNELEIMGTIVNGIYLR